MERAGGTDGSHAKAAKTLAAGSATVGMLTSNIKNKIVRAEAYDRLKKAKKKTQKKAQEKRQREVAKAEELGIVPERKVPKTLENTREQDVTTVQDGDEDVEVENEHDEFAEHFQNLRPPHVLLTTSFKATAGMYKFCSDLMTVFPSAVFYKRQGYALKKIVEYAKKNDFTDVVVVNEDKKILNGMVVCHLPDGPTAMFNLSSVVLNRDIKGRGKPTEHKPELVLNNFGTRLGYRIGRMFGSLFCQDPTFRGRRVITFHNQRDYIFFRHHRYAFEEKERDVVTTTVKDGKKKVKTTGSETFVAPRLQELGPRFTLKLTRLQRGTFDTTTGEFEWVHKRKEMDTSRRKFHL